MYAGILVLKWNSVFGRSGYLSEQNQYTAKGFGAIPHVSSTIRI